MFSENKTYVAEGTLVFKQFLVQVFRLERPTRTPVPLKTRKNIFTIVNFLIQSVGRLDGPHLGKCCESNRLILIKATDKTK